MEKEKIVNMECRLGEKITLKEKTEKRKLQILVSMGKKQGRNVMELSIILAFLSVPDLGELT